MTRYSMGIDPDLHNTSLAFLQDGVPVAVDVVTIKDTFKGRRAAIEMADKIRVFFNNFEAPFLSSFAVESQDVYLGKTKDPESILLIAHVTGAALMACTAFALKDATGFCPRPADWKGQVPKRIHQARVLTKLKIPHKATGSEKTGYCVPNMAMNRAFGEKKILKGEYKHVVDALGLAVWADDQNQARVRKTQPWVALA